MTLQIVRKPMSIGKVWKIVGIDHCRIVSAGGEYGVFVNDRLEKRSEHWSEIVTFCHEFFSYRV